ncbi:hypothetical protein KIPB_015942, partial [Kipferlia bialata]|eukprot:g15942.t1
MTKQAQCIICQHRLPP